MEVELEGLTGGGAAGEVRSVISSPLSLELPQPILVVVCSAQESYGLGKRVSDDDRIALRGQIGNWRTRKSIRRRGAGRGERAPWLANADLYICQSKCL